MRACGVRYSFISTYRQSVFLKIVKQDDSTYALLRSRCYLYTEKAVYDSTTENLKASVLRLGLTYLLHRASHGEKSVWSIEAEKIKPDDWTRLGTSLELYNEAWPYDSPYNMITRAYAELRRIICQL